MEINISLIREIADTINEKGLSRIEYRDAAQSTIIVEKLHGQQVANVQPQNVSEKVEKVTPVSSPIVQKPSEMPYTEVKSPIVGVFYAAASPDGEPFLTIGSQVQKGDILCIIEAMKLMNDVVAEADGEIVDICIKNGDVAEYGQVLFMIK